MTAVPSAPTDLKTALEEMRASVAARRTRTRVGEAIQEAILGLLNTLMAILEDLRAGRLAPVAPVAEAAGKGLLLARRLLMPHLLTPHPSPLPQGEREDCCAAWAARCAALAWLAASAGLAGRLSPLRLARCVAHCARARRRAAARRSRQLGRTRVRRFHPRCAGTDCGLCATAGARRDSATGGGHAPGVRRAFPCCAVGAAKGDFLKIRF